MNLPTILILCAVAVLAGAAIYFHFKNSRSCCGGKNERGGCSCGCCKRGECGNSGSKKANKQNDLSQCKNSGQKNDGKK